jgi:hypothetical protein
LGDDLGLGSPSKSPYAGATGRRYRWPARVGAALALAGALLSPSPVFGSISGGHGFFQMERESAFVLLFKNIRVPKSAEENVIWFAIPSGRTTEGYNSGQRRDAVVDVLPFGGLWDWRKLIQWANADEHIVNNDRRFSVVVDTSKITISIIPLSKPSGDIGPLHLPPVFQLAAIDGPNRCGEPCDNSGRNGGEGGGDHIKKFSDLDQRVNRYVISDAFFVACVLGFLTILYIRGNPS